MQESQREGEKGIWEVVPFVVMVVMEGCTIALTIFAKTVMTKKGMSPFVFVVYMHALSSLILLPYSFIFHYKDRTQQPFFTSSLFLRLSFMGLTGITISQNLAFLGLSYSSPIVVCAMGLLIPSLSFILSIILRKTKLDWRNSSFRAKVTGTIISFMGATMVELYKGPLIRKSKLSSSHHPSYPTINKFLIYSSTPEYWVLGGILLATSSLSVSVWNNIQVGTVKQYPQVMKLVSFYSLFGTIQSAMLCLFLERNPDAWKLKLDTELLLIGLSAVFAGLIRSHVHMWCMQLKGPFYVPIFKPFGIVFATIFGVILSAVHYGSVIGAIIIGTGYFSVMYGQLKEEELKAQQDDKVKIKESCEDEKVPLLQEENIV